MINLFPRCYGYGYIVIITTAIKLQKSRVMFGGMLILFVLLIHLLSISFVKDVSIIVFRDH